MTLDFLEMAFQYWINTQWHIALLMSFGVNCAVYLITAAVINLVTSTLNANGRIGTLIDNQTLKKNQVKKEMAYGLVACLIFAMTSLATRALFENIWPVSIMGFLIQLVLFGIFYETYSYFIHRLLHIRILRFAHSVHHSSVRVTPWSAYSVHPLEALFIGISAPIYMFLYPMSLSLILVLHIFGMVFTMFIHSNFSLNQSVLLSKQFNGYTNGHSQHHRKGVFNFGFTHSFWDKVFKTKYEQA